MPFGFRPGEVETLSTREIRYYRDRAERRVSADRVNALTDLSVSNGVEHGKSLEGNLSEARRDRAKYWYGDKPFQLHLQRLSDHAWPENVLSPEELEAKRYAESLARVDAFLDLEPGWENVN